jgi:hypothetical protein
MCSHSTGKDLVEDGIPTTTQRFRNLNKGPGESSGSNNEMATGTGNVLSQNRASSFGKGERSVEKPRKRWLHDFKNNLKKMGVRRCRKIDKDRDA